MGSDQADESAEKKKKLLKSSDAAVATGKEPSAHLIVAEERGS